MSTPETAISGDMLTVRISIWDSGCLPVLLQKEMCNVATRLRIIGEQLSAEARGQHEAYLGQLQACLAAVKAARR